MKVLCNFSRKSYRQKPKGGEVRKVQRELMQPKEIELEELANIIVNGCNFRPAAVNGKQDVGFISQQIFSLDFDNTDEKNMMMPLDAVAMAKEKGIKPSFVYSTFSNTEEKPKFRMVFLLNAPIYDLEERNKVQLGLMKHFEKYIDEKCGNPARVFFGSQSKSFIYSDFKAVNTKESVLNGTDLQNNGTVRKKNIMKNTIPKSKNAYCNIEAIKNHDADYLKKSLKIPKKKIVFNNRKEFLNYLYKEIDMAELLEVTEKKNFCCILPEHDDKEPSANVFREKFGTWRYKCFGSRCNANLNTKQIIEKLGCFSSEYKAIEFIKKVYNLEIKETEWSKEQEANIDSILECVSGTNGENNFSSICPTADKNTKNAQQAFIQILLIAKSAIFPDRAGKDNDSIIFYMSVNQLMRALKKNSSSQIQRYLTILKYHKMIIPLDDKDVPRQFLSKALKNKAENHKHISFYKIPSWVCNWTIEIENQGKKWKENRYTMKGTSYEMFYRTEGAEVAGRLYPQHKTIATVEGKTVKRRTSKKSDKLYNEVQEIMGYLIDSQGYCTEKQILEIMCMNGMGREKAEYRLKQYIPDLMACNNLKKRRCNKELKERFSIETAKNSYPSIIYHEI